LSGFQFSFLCGHSYIVFCGTLAGINTWTGFEDYAQEHEESLKQFIDLSEGIPSHDTIARVISALNIEEFERCFRGFTQDLMERSKGIIAIDGKTIRGSFDHKKGLSARHIVSAWSQNCRLVLGQLKVDDKTNEITVIPELLSLLDLNEQIVTIDAMGCQRNICEQIRQKHGDYVISLKGNQGTLHRDIELFFQDSQSMITQIWEEFDKGHGRIEHRQCVVTDDIAAVS
jgi:predicted transposase YbfD/YdcC